MSGATTSTPEVEPLACPRCDSRDTKFCYYNNYSTAQPRHFCRNCKRYWTAGGSLRNVPVGGGLRKNKKSKLSKHGKDLLSANRDGFCSPGKATTPGPFSSPSSSADGAMEETSGSPRVSPFPYQPTFEFVTSDNEFDNIPSSATSYQLDCTNFRQDSPKELDNARLTIIHNDCVPRHASNNYYQQQNWDENVDQIESNYNKMPSEPSHASCYESAIQTSTYNGACTAIRTHHDAKGREINRERKLQRSLEDARISDVQGRFRWYAEERAFSHDDISRSISSRDYSDDGLPHVISVRDPYDCEQGSEVLFGGMPDFFQMPTF
ncbi:hypothetical protein KP509_19G053600 [Ceratopteris richardii]|uniref:Dof-type domain-containing protein n=1 Tax=Ceratopteris richardii TaxID=49495 RepID=A0A8T2SMF5_CERRI|nr:hypothetical protein KP509_19G053600 [Ceratopteris richardii]KAH7352602.1 hypothetical protein KP509_19G053600 [Ceratopteris richardii]